MEPEHYKGFKCTLVPLPTYIPVNESPAHQDGDHIQLGPAGTEWAVFSPNILRGNLEQSKEDDGDLRTHVGWKEESSRKWMSSTEQQPFFLNQIDYGDMDDEP